MPLAITDFDFEMQPADPDALIAVWMPKIEAAAETHVPDNRFVAFLTAAMLARCTVQEPQWIECQQAD